MMKKKTQNNNNENNGDSGKKQKSSSGVTTVVLRIDLNCEGCAGKVVKVVRTLDGVESVTIGDKDLNKLTVMGKLDPVKLRQKVEEKTKKKVELISPTIKKTTPDDQQDQKPSSEKTKSTGRKDQKKPKELPVTTVMLKLHLDCQGCVRRIQKHVSKTKGYMEMCVDKKKDLVTVKGAIDMKLLAEALQHKLKRAVEILPMKKDGGDAEKRGGGDKKGNSGGNCKEIRKDGGGGGNVKHDEGVKMENWGGPMVYSYPRYAYGSGYADYVHAPLLFSDENPNACVAM